MLLALVAAMLPTIALASSPEGEWWVHDKQARITIANCDGAIWGVITWEATPGVDSHNPDPAKRSRPMLGVPIILGMKPDGDNKWKGSIYNSAFGQTVSGDIALPKNDMLRINGCVLGFLCGGENWTRATEAVAAKVSTKPVAICDSISPPG
jgi:uncharacterized protein (DUF2147 family)